MRARDPQRRSASWQRDEARLGVGARASRRSATIALDRGLSDRLDDLGIAAPARPPHALARASLCRRGQLSRGAGRSAVLERARRTRGCSSVVTVSLELAAGLLLALALDRLSRGARAGAHRGAPAVGHSDRRRRAGLALHVREPGRARRRAARRLGRGAADVVCRRVGGLGPAGAGRRLEDDAVRRAPAARRSAEHRSIAVRSRRRWTARGHGGSSPTSRCRC